MAGDEELIKEYSKIHKSHDWGWTSVKNLRFLLPYVRILRPQSIIDYGCGTSPLLKLLDVDSIRERRHFDPAITEHAEPPTKAYDLLVSIDVLEHVDEEHLDEVIAHMAELSKEAIIIVDTKPAALLLADGRNAHLSLHDHHWWQMRLEKHFGPMIPIKVKRRSRASFRTWELTTFQKIQWTYWRFTEFLSYLKRRVGGTRY